MHSYSIKQRPAYLIPASGCRICVASLLRLQRLGGEDGPYAAVLA